MSRVFLIGNGISRRDIKLETLRPHGDIFGCNALYREFTPDVLVCVDHRMAYEIAKSGFARDTACACTVYSTWYKDFETTQKNMDGFKWLDFNKDRNLASGPSTLYKALEMGYQEIYLVGHDLKPVEGDKINDIYAGTGNYRQVGAKSINHETTFARELKNVVDEFKGKYNFRIYRVVDENCGTPAPIKELFRPMDKKKFLDKFNVSCYNDETEIKMHVGNDADPALRQEVRVKTLGD